MTKANNTTKTNDAVLKAFIKKEFEAKYSKEIAELKQTIKDQAKELKEQAKKNELEILNKLVREKNENIRNAEKIDSLDFSTAQTKVYQAIANSINTTGVTTIFLYRTNSEGNRANQVLYYMLEDGLATQRKTTTRNNIDFIEEIRIDLNQFYEKACNDENLIYKWNKLYYMLPDNIQTIYTALQKEKRFVERDVTDRYFIDEQADLI